MGIGVGRGVVRERSRRRYLKERTMDEILELASKLGKAIAASERFQALRRAEEAIEKDEKAQQLTEALHKQSEKIRNLETKMEPVFPDDKRELARIQEEIAGHQPLKAFARAQADYAEMMARVNGAIRAELDREDGR
jgi:cell fate (sporulation/competence/biofilm development) regulator YlbF (YheA/YmcA/DUF963 family)